MNRVVFRVDGSQQLGMGHIMRCIAFAQGLSAQGMEPAFVMRSLDAKVAKVVASHGYLVEELPAKTTLESDYESTRDFAAVQGACLLVADICNTETHADLPALYQYHQKLASDFFLVAMAGDRAFDLQAHVVVAPYMETSFGDLESRLDRVVLAGAEYVIMRAEFVAAASQERVIREQAGSILITVGGSDKYHSTTKTLQAISLLDWPRLELKVVLAAGFTSELRLEVASLLKKSGYRHETLGQDVDMADAMTWADIAITGDGVTKYESAVTGTPSIMISRPESNDDLNRAFQAAGTTVFLGDCTAISTEYLCSEIRDLLNNLAKREEMSRLGKTLIDGKGLERILRHIPQDVLGG